MLNREYRDKFSQMIILGLDVDEINSEIISLIRDYKIGGVVIYKKSYHTTLEMVDYINKLKMINKDNIGMFIAIDQENGRVNRLSNDIVKMPSASKVASSKNMDYVRSVARVTADILSMVGVNMNFSPVLDINRGDVNSIIGDRGYGSNRRDVIKFGLPFMEELTNKKIISVVKHFPGHGLCNVNSHYLIPKIKDVKLMEREDSKVFEEAILAGCDAIMVGHLRVRGYGMKPATINKRIIRDYLIDKYNYQGLVVTDDLRMNLLGMIYGMDRVVKSSVDGLNNLLVIKYRKGDTKLYDRLYRMVDNGKIDRNLIDSSYNKIMSIKRKYGINNDRVIDKIDVLKINQMIRKLDTLV